MFERISARSSAEKEILAGGTRIGQKLLARC